MNGIGPHQRGWRDLGIAEAADFPALHETGEGLGDLLDRGLGIPAVNVEQIDAVDAEARQRGIELAFQIVAGIVVTARTRLRITGDTGLRRDGEHVASAIALLGKKAANGRLGLVRAVDVRGVDMRHAFVKRRLQNGMGLRFICRAVEVRKGHRANADGGNQGAIGAKTSCLHEERPSEISP